MAPSSGFRFIHIKVFAADLEERVSATPCSKTPLASLALAHASRFLASSSLAFDESHRLLWQRPSRRSSWPLSINVNPVRGARNIPVEKYRSSRLLRRQIGSYVPGSGAALWTCTSCSDLAALCLASTETRANTLLRVTSRTYRYRDVPLPAPRATTWVCSRKSLLKRTATHHLAMRKSTRPMNTSKMSSAVRLGVKRSMRPWPGASSGSLMCT